MTKMWGDKRFNNLNYFLRNKFGGKVFKISLDAGFSCPNRDGRVSYGGCTFCSERGSGDFAGSRVKSITEQFNDIKEMMHKKWKSDKYIAYFQAYSNTYAPVDELRDKYYEAINQEGVIALAIATRPDCISDEALDLLEEINQKVYVWVELGLQTSNDESAKLINRGYDLSIFEETLKRLRERNIDVVVHDILGLPGETREDMLNTVEYIAKQDIQGVKFHLLHLMKGTRMVKDYEEGRLQFLEKDEYIEILCKAITMLPEEMVIHRITGDAPRDLLIGPMWSLKKWEVLNSIEDYMKEHDIYQGKEYC